MWTCPNCGRAFRGETQQHDCGKAPESIDEYINAQDEALREPLRQVRRAVYQRVRRPQGGPDRSEQPGEGPDQR